MNRRQFLAACAAVGVAGCGAGSEEIDTEATSDPATEGAGDASGAQTTDTQTPTQTATATATDEPTPTGTPTPAGEAEITIASQSLERDEGEFTTTTYAAATIVNQSDVMSGQISLTARFYNDDDSLLTTSPGVLAALPARNRWEAVIPYLGDASQVARAEVRGEFATVPPETEPDDISLDSATLSRSERQTTVSGEATNNRPGPLRYLEANALIKASDDVVLGSALTNVNDLGSGETWAFEAIWLGASSHPRTARTHETFLTTSAL